MRALTLLAAVVLVSACAKNPDNISAADIGSATYKNYSCSLLANERLTLNQNLENLSAQQRQAASSDAWGVFLVGLPVSSMSGNDKEADISIVKGQIQAIDKERQAKRCI